MVEEAFQYPTRLGRAAELPGGPFLLPADWRKKEDRVCGPLECLSSSASAATLAVNATVQIGHLSLGGGEELLELILKRLVAGGR